jgi:hypothetical protein
MTRRERMMLPAGMACLFAGLMLKRHGGEGYLPLILQPILYGASIFMNIRFMLKHREERLRTGAGD